MRRLTPFMFAILALSAPAAVLAQDARDAAGGGRRAVIGPDPIARLLAQRDALELTGEQVERLEGIREQLHDLRTPLVERADAMRSERQGRQMRRYLERLTPEQREELRRELDRLSAERHEEFGKGRAQLTPEQRQELRERMDSLRAERRERMEAVRKQFDELRRNLDAAREEALSLLTDEQREKLDELREARIREFRGRRPGPPRPMRRWRMHEPVR